MDLRITLCTKIVAATLFTTFPALLARTTLVI